ncbi:aminoglycoside phosphotransferase family protein [Streptomyces olivochromogenes]|uniref:aminoglycoside phosphotransferase family protein n=1 Tax=Streptomyces olivochromogenes TaxID=1963 RepID=UPI001F33EA36|nr:aminoglycoside phosphotransferase family protein [Streptomyces olivochromogenes]MCF3130634.1 hydroxyurea phosphotransferase [Streptomyces olivochromogenes]
MIEVPAEPAASQRKFNEEAGRAFVAGLPRRAEEFLRRRRLRPDGPAMHGVCALVLPVVSAEGTPAALKLQPLDAESAGEPLALRAWAGVGAVRLLEHDEPTCTLLLERLDETRVLAGLPEVREAVLVIGALLARLTARPAPPGLRRLGDVARQLLERTAQAAERVPDPADRRLLGHCAAAVREVAGEPGDQLLHWDLHYANVLAADRADWLAIDPKPLAGDPGFELLPALANRYDPADTRWRFDALSDALGLDRERARAWTLGRVLQNCLWEIEDGRPPETVPLEIGRLLRG